MNETYINNMQDLSKILKTREGIDFFVLHLKALNVCEIVDHTDVRRTIEKNIGLGLLEIIFKADPNAFHKIQNKLRGHYAE